MVAVRTSAFIIVDNKYNTVITICIVCVRICVVEGSRAARGNRETKDTFARYHGIKYMFSIECHTLVL